jgi:Domain of unknown function (DUF1995)
MVVLPQTLEDALAQARAATKAALDDGYRLVQVEIGFSELKAQSIAEQFLPIMDDLGMLPKVFFPDTGAAALARRDWGDIPFKIADLGSRRLAIETSIEPDDEWFLLIEPSAIEVAQVEKLCQSTGDRPVVLLIPRLEDVATLGIGYAGRQLRDRFLNTIESCYYIRPLEGASVFRCYPSPWQVWQDTETGESELISETPTKPVGDVLDRILAGETPLQEEVSPSAVSQTSRKRPGFLSQLQRFLKVLNQ